MFKKLKMFVYWLFAFIFWIFATSLLSSSASAANSMTWAVNDIFDHWIATTSSILSWTFWTVIAFIVWVAILGVIISFVLAYVRR